MTNIGRQTEDRGGRINILADTTFAEKLGERGVEEREANGKTNAKKRNQILEVRQT